MTLSQQNLDRIKTELEQVATAISVAGTRRQKLLELSRLVVPVIESLVGVRPEVKKVRDSLRRESHNVAHSKTRAVYAAKNVRALASAVGNTKRLLRMGLGDVPAAFGVGEMVLLNVWGYTDRELVPFLNSIRRAHDFIKKTGLSEDIERTSVLLDPNDAGGKALFYDPINDSFSADPIAGKHRYRDIIDAFAGKIWVKKFGKSDVNVWGEPSVAWYPFSDAFFLIATGKPISNDVMERMSSTFGRVIGHQNWSKVSKGASV